MNKNLKVPFGEFHSFVSSLDLGIWIPVGDVIVQLVYADKHDLQDGGLSGTLVVLAGNSSFTNGGGAQRIGKARMQCHGFTSSSS